MTTITTTIEQPGATFAVDPAELAAIAFLARYSGRTLDAYGRDLRNLFQWSALTIPTPPWRYSSG